MITRKDSNAIQHYTHEIMDIRDTLMQVHFKDIDQFREWLKGEMHQIIGALDYDRANGSNEID